MPEEIQVEQLRYGSREIAAQNLIANKESQHEPTNDLYRTPDCFFVGHAVPGRSCNWLPDSSCFSAVNMKTLLALTLLVATTAQSDPLVGPWSSDVSLLIESRDWTELMTSPFQASEFVSSARDYREEIKRRILLRKNGHMADVVARPF